MLPIDQLTPHQTAEAGPGASPLCAEDADFLADFEALRWPEAAFGHREHVRLAWTCLRIDPAGAAGRVAADIRRFATHHGAAGKFHVTITEAWVRIVAGALAATPAGDAEPFAAWIDRARSLLDARRLSAHYSASRLQSAEARAAWVDPDLTPLL